jgi:uncharacterized protein YndB with AHSA1/START domain
MSVKQEPNGRRSLGVEFEVQGTPEEVWKAIATGPGISAWFVPTTVEERDGKPVEVKVTFGGMEMSSEVTEWDPPRKFTRTAAGWLPGSPLIAAEWTVEARAGGTCVVRIVQSLFASTDEWDMQLESANAGFASFLKLLQLYLAHFRGQSSAMHEFRAPAPATDDRESWEALTASFGLKGLRVGQRFTAPAGVPPLSGVVEYVTQDPFDALLRIEQPAPGVAALGIAGYPGTLSMVGMNLYLYGDRAPDTLSREMPRWESWFQQRFPTAVEPGSGK